MVFLELRDYYTHTTGFHLSSSSTCSMAPQRSAETCCSWAPEHFATDVQLYTEKINDGWIWIEGSWKFGAR